MPIIEPSTPVRACACLCVVACVRVSVRRCVGGFASACMRASVCMRVHARACVPGHRAAVRLCAPYVLGRTTSSTEAPSSPKHARAKSVKRSENQTKSKKTKKILVDPASGRHFPVPNFQAYGNLCKCNRDSRVLGRLFPSTLLGEALSPIKCDGSLKNGFKGSFVILNSF